MRLSSSLSRSLSRLHLVHTFEYAQCICDVYSVCNRIRVSELRVTQHWRHITWILIRLSTMAHELHVAPKHTHAAREGGERVVVTLNGSHTVRCQRMPSHSIVSTQINILIECICVSCTLISFFTCHPVVV